jgi:hypothetical protein
MPATYHTSSSVVLHGPGGCAHSLMTLLPVLLVQQTLRGLENVGSNKSQDEAGAADPEMTPRGPLI